MIAVVAAVLLQGSWDKTLSTGAKLTLAAVSDDYQQISWLPWGPKLSKWMRPSFVGSKNPTVNPNNILTVDLVIDNLKSSEFPSLKMYEGARKLAKEATVGYLDDFALAHSPYLATATRPFPVGKESCVLRIACAGGTWNRAGAYDLLSKRASGLAFSPKVTFSNATKKNEVNMVEVVIKLDKSLLDGNTDYRIVAFAENGKKLPSAGSEAMPHAIGPTEFWFTRYDHKVVRLEIQTRKFEWFEFRDVHLIPNK